MTRRRLIPLVVGVVALLAVVAVAARGRPLGSHGNGGGGLPQTFWNFAFTTLVIAVVLIGLAGLYAFMLIRRDPQKPKSYGSRTARALAILIAAAIVVYLIGRHVNIAHLFHTATPKKKLHARFTPTGGPNNPASPPGRGAHFRWDELAIVFALLLLVGGALYMTRARPKGIRWLREGEAEAAMLAALDESIDDLWAEPDLRRAIVAAYARMEKALARAGIPRHPAEAPLEYMARTLLALNTSADSVRRLTDLFEWARFSHHEPEPSMRDEAVAALVAVRDELRAAEPVAT